MRTFLMLAIVLITAISSTNAAVPQLINYQGVLTDSTGAGLDTTVPVTFSIYDAAVGGTLIWSEPIPNVTVTAGLFSVLLGSVTTLSGSVFDDTTRYLGIKVGSDPEILPRTLLVSVPYSFKSEHADVSDSAVFSDSTSAITDGAVDMADIGQAGAASGQILKWNGSAWAPAADNTGTASGWTDDGTVVRLDAVGDFVGIGTSAPSEKLDVVGNLVVSGKANIGPGNANAGLNAFVTGTLNSASGHYSTVGGGLGNSASGTRSTVGGGQENTAIGPRSTVGGGIGNIASGTYSTVGGGRNATASGLNSTVGGGFTNTANDTAATVSGGRTNTASGSNSTVGGGVGNTASGGGSTVGGGFYNTASGTQSTAIGTVAKAQHNGSIVIAANSSGSTTDSIASGGAEQLVIRADGGLYLTNISETPAPYDPSKIITTRGGAYLSGNGTTWTNASDKNQKENFTDIDSEELLKKISALPISRWNYKDEDETVTHIGPVAQDFYALFGVGADDISISTIDPAGIALAAIQELYKKSKRVDELNERLEKLEKMIDELSNK